MAHAFRRIYFLNYDESSKSHIKFQYGLENILLTTFKMIAVSPTCLIDSNILQIVKETRVIKIIPNLLNKNRC